MDIVRRKVILVTIGTHKGLNKGAVYQVNLTNITNVSNKVLTCF